MENLFVRRGTAYAIGGFFDSPVREPIESQACVNLAGVGSVGEAEASAFSHHKIKFQSAKTEVTGISSRNEESHVTVIKTSIHDLDIMNVVTAKAVHARMVATTFPEEEIGGLGPKSEFSFWGTTFEDLRVFGTSFAVPDPFPILNGNEPHQYEKVLKRLKKAFDCTDGVRLVSSLMDNARDEKLAQINEVEAEKAWSRISDTTKARDEGRINENDAAAAIRAASRDASGKIQRNEILPIKLDGFGRVYVAEVQYNPYLSCLNMLRVEVKCGDIQGHIQIGAVEGGGSCWPGRNP